MLPELSPDKRLDPQLHNYVLPENITFLVFSVLNRPKLILWKLSQAVLRYFLAQLGKKLDRQEVVKMNTLKQ